MEREQLAHTQHRASHSADVVLVAGSLRRSLAIERKELTNSIGSLTALVTDGFGPGRRPSSALISSASWYAQRIAGGVKLRLSLPLFATVEMPAGQIRGSEAVGPSSACLIEPALAVCQQEGLLLADLESTAYGAFVFVPGSFAVVNKALGRIARIRVLRRLLRREPRTRTSPMSANVPRRRVDRPRRRTPKRVVKEEHPLSAEGGATAGVHV